jgi:transposase-like protein
MTRRGRRGNSERQQYWEGIVRRWKESGRSVRGFCRAEGLRESAFYCWRRELERRKPQATAVEVPEPQTGSVTPTPSRGKPLLRQDRPGPSFVPVHLVASAAGPAAGGVEIVLGQGRTIRVPPGFDRQTLASVLALLEGQPC